MSRSEKHASRPAVWACVLATLASGPLACTRVRAEDATESEAKNAATERARVHFKNGVDFYREHNFRAALIEFKRAYKASPHYKLLYNLGQASLELQEDSSAIDYFSSYLEEGQGELDVERKQEVAQTIVRLQARLASATISVDQAGAEIYVDQTLLGTSPLSGPVKVSVGRRRFSAVKHGFVTAERSMDVAAGDRVVIALELKPSTQDIGALQKALAKHAEDTHDSLSPAAWTAIGTGAIAVGAGTMTVLTVLAQKSYDDERKHLTSAAKLASLRDDAKRKALITDIAWGATIAAASVTAILFFTDTGSEHAPDEPKSGIDVELGLGGVGMSGRF